MIVLAVSRDYATMIKKPPNPPPKMNPLLKKWINTLLRRKKSQINVFLDMDGVLVNFDGAVKTEILKNYYENAEMLHPDDPTRQRTLRKLQKLELSPREITDLYDSVNEKYKFGQSYTRKEQIFRDYFYALLTNNKKLWIEMKKLKNSDFLVKNALRYADNVYILSAPLDKVCREAKREWIAAHFEENFGIESTNVYLAVDKGAKLLDLVNRGTVSLDDKNILIDDMPKYIKTFAAAGGKGIQYDYEAPLRAIDELKALVNN